MVGPSEIRVLFWRVGGPSERRSLERFTIGDRNGSTRLDATPDSDGPFLAWLTRRSCLHTIHLRLSPQRSDLAEDAMARPVGPAVAFAVVAYAGCAANVRDTDLLASNSVMLAPSTANTIFIQNRNSSDNQAVSLSDLGARLSAKGYQVVTDPQAAAYVVLTNIVYCNQTKVELPVDDMVAGGYGSGFNSVMSGLGSLSSMAGMAGPQGAMAGAAASMGIGAISSIGNSVGNLFGGRSRPKFDENVNYACVADVQITDRALTGGAIAPPASGGPPPTGWYQTRLAASVHQKKLDAQEATPLVQQRLSAAVAGHF